MEINPNTASFPLIQDHTLTFIENKAAKSSLRKIVEFLKTPGDHFSKISPEDKEKLKTYLRDRHVTLTKKPITTRERIVRFFKSIVQWILNRGQSSSALTKKGLDIISQHEHAAFENRLKTIKETLSQFNNKVKMWQKATATLADIDKQKPSAKASSNLPHLRASKEQEISKLKAEIDTLYSSFKSTKSELMNLKKDLSESHFNDLKDQIEFVTREISLIEVKLQGSSKKETGAIYVDSKNLFRAHPQVITQLIPEFLEQIQDGLMNFKIESKVPEISLKMNEKDRIMTSSQQLINTYGDANLTYSMASGYSVEPKKPKERIGDPIADDIRLTKYSTNDKGTVYIMGVSDGVGHSKRAKEAAVTANIGFEKYCAEKLSQNINTKHDLVKVVIEGVKHAQQNIKPPEGETQSGETTFSGTVIKSHPNGAATAVITTVGDIKYFVVRADGSVEEVTKGNRLSGDVRDSGGRLTAEDVDLRNFGVFITELNQGDVLLAMSDGVHDNLNPSTVESRTPEEVYQMLLDAPLVDEAAKESLIAIKDRIPKAWEHKGEISEELGLLQDIYMLHCIKELNSNRDYNTPLSEKLTKLMLRSR